MVKVKKGFLCLGLLMVVSGTIIVNTGWDYKYDRPVEEWVGWIFVLYGSCMIYCSIFKK